MEVPLGSPVPNNRLLLSGLTHILVAGSHPWRLPAPVTSLPCLSLHPHLVLMLDSRFSLPHVQIHANMDLPPTVLPATPLATTTVSLTRSCLRLLCSLLRAGKGLSVEYIAASCASIHIPSSSDAISGCSLRIPCELPTMQGCLLFRNLGASFPHPLDTTHPCPPHPTPSPRAGHIACSPVF